ncbi:replication protein [Hydromonas duriensis]|uniref:Replication protein RepL n=1 Tax=Hydromonas duriensis TaxID=1527608 RepID=A0A4R6Y0N7_9BURK|nr:replication protein [Hydromonas duriensis]TDR27801.1 hypothetical protein DFR44_1385 [Hydromonas duriensis]
MAKPIQSRRGAAKYEKNPFLPDALSNSKTGTKRLSNKKGDKFMVVSESGETVAPAGFHEIIEVDKTKFVKLYINGVKAFQGLTSAGAKVFEVIYHAVQESPGSDRLYLHFMSVEQNITPISRATFFRGMAELIDKGFIAESVEPGMYFLNIDYLFNGNRLAFIKEYRITSMKETIENSVAKRDAADSAKRDSKTLDIFESSAE